QQGTLFRMTTNGAVTTLHAFAGGNDGASPSAGLIQATDGNLYGTANSGGANYIGTLFRMSLNGALTTLHAFNYGDGASPTAPLIQASDGNFYGTTSSGGSSNSGTAFKFTRSGAFTSLHSFQGVDGSTPLAGLVQGNDGNLYGATKAGGVNPYDGTV